MRTIIIKNIRHLYLLYVLSALLLQGSVIMAANINDKSRQQLLENAQTQQQKLINTYGLSLHSKWHEKCHQLIESLELLQFNQCLVIKASFANAYSLAHGTVILTENLLKNINNDDQLGHILAHEHAHLELNHHQQTQQLLNKPPKLFTKSRVKQFYRNIEQQADQSADELLKAHQFDWLQIHHYLLRIEQNTIERSNDHQKFKQRIHRNGLPAEKFESFWVDKDR